MREGGLGRIQTQPYPYTKQTHWPPPGAVMVTLIVVRVKMESGDNTLCPPCAMWVEPKV